MSLNGYGQFTRERIIEKNEYKNFTATAYCLQGITASGRKVGNGQIAVDPRIIPLGTKVDILGFGVFIATDTGRDIKKSRIDVWMSCKKAIRFGRRIIKVRRI